MESKLKILMVTPECEQIYKISGVGDVVAGLSIALKEHGVDVRIVMPKYEHIFPLKPDRIDKTFQVTFGAEPKKYAVDTWKLKNIVPVYFIEYNDFFYRKGIYGDDTVSFHDNARRFAFFSLAAISFLDNEFIPDVIHCHNWPSALVPVYLQKHNSLRLKYQKTGILLTIHTIESKEDQGLFDISPGHVSLPDDDDHLLKSDHLHMLKAGIAYSDIVNIVSETFLKETQDETDPFQLKTYLDNKKGDYRSILNGVDYSIWSPENDNSIAVKYSKSTKEEKKICKAALQADFRLDINNDIPLIGAIGPFKEAKNFNLIQQVLPRLIGDDKLKMQFILLGHGRSFIVPEFLKMQKTYEKQVGIRLIFDDNTSHLVVAGCDFLLLPSFLEPCGLLAMYCQKYGTIPIAHAIGGFIDTVIDFKKDPVKGTGFLFKPCDAFELKETIKSAIEIYHSKDKMNCLIDHAMDRDFSWQIRSMEYIQIYDILSKRKLRNHLNMQSGPVFISYSRKDKIIARRIVERLQSEKIIVWFDENDLQGGSKWDPNIIDSIKNAQKFLAICSDSYLNSQGYHGGELNCALEKENQRPPNYLKCFFIIPLLIEKITIINPELNDLHYIQLFPDPPTSQTEEQAFEIAIERVIDSIHARPT